MVINDTYTLQEMQTFREDSGKLGAGQGYHDDCVIALALANWGVQNGAASFAGFYGEDWR